MGPPRPAAETPKRGDGQIKKGGYAEVGTH